MPPLPGPTDIWTYHGYNLGTTKVKSETQNHSVWTILVHFLFALVLYMIVGCATTTTQILSEWCKRTLPCHAPQIWAEFEIMKPTRDQIILLQHSSFVFPLLKIYFVYFQHRLSFCNSAGDLISKSAHFSR